MKRLFLRGSRRPKWLLVPGLLLAWGLTVFGAPIEVSNHSFELPALGAAGWTNDLPASTGANDPQWIGRDGSNHGDTFIEFIGGFFSEGNQHIGMANGYYVFQNLGVPFEPNTTYTLTVGVGYRNPNQSGTESFTIIGLTSQDEPPSDSNSLEGTNANDQIDVDPLLAEAFTRVDSVALNNAQVHTFTDVTVELYTTGDTPPAGNIVIFLGDDEGCVRSHFDNVRLDAITALDPDGDQIPEEWETGTDRGVARGLDPNVDDGGEDPDGDTLTNFEEFELGTHPQLADTDGDGLNDNFEDTTDPLDPDVDGDTLLDGAEIATHQTDPNNPDTDDDDFEDQAEIAAGTDPLDPDSKPTRGGAILIGGNFVGGNADSAGAEVTGSAGVVPQENWINLPGGSGKPVIANTAEGEASLLRVSYATNGPGIAGDAPGGDGDEQLMYGLLVARGDGAGGDDVLTTITVKNIAYPLYDVYVYFNADGGGGGTYTANGQTITVNEIVPFDGTFAEVTEDGGSGNYIHLENLTGSTLTITGGQLNGGGGIAGFQLYRIEPGDSKAAYQCWSGFSRTEDDATRFGADLNHDRIPNGLAFFVGASGPFAHAEAFLPTSSLVSDPGTETEYYEIVVRRAHAAVDLPFAVNYATDLSSWRMAMDGVNGVVQSIIDDGFAAGVDKIVVRIPVEGRMRLFTSLTVWEE